MFSIAVLAIQSPVLISTAELRKAITSTQAASTTTANRIWAADWPLAVPALAGLQIGRQEAAGWRCRLRSNFGCKVLSNVGCISAAPASTHINQNSLDQLLAGSGYAAWMLWVTLMMPVRNIIAFWFLAAASSTAIGAIAITQESGAYVPFKPFAIEFLHGVPRSVGGVGIYLGTGFAITAAHVTGQYSGWVRVGGEDVPASLIKFGYPAVDLALFRLPKAKLPSDLQDVRLQLCTEQPGPGTAAVVVTGPERITDTSLADPAMLRPESRIKWGTMIADVETSGRSGSGVFQADKRCLLGILSSLITNTATQKAIGTFYVSAATIREFLAGIPAAASLAK
jgi:hypothetical protein